MFSWVKKKANTAQRESFENSTPLGIDDVRKLTKYAAHVRATLQESIPGFDYNPASLKILSDIITKERLRYGEERTVQLANLYGAYFGHVVLLAHRELRGTWVRNSEGIGLQLGPPDRKQIMFPITRVFKHIEKGEEYSIYSLYAAICSMFNIDIPKNSATVTPQSTAPKAASDVDALDREMENVLAEVRAEFETRRKVLNERTFSSIRVGNPSWLAPTDPLAEIEKQQLFLHREGRIVWGGVMQANSLLFSQGTDDCPGTLLHSSDPYFDARPQQLRRIAAKAFGVLEKSAGPEERQFAERVQDSRNRAMNLRLPESLTPKDVRATNCILYRKHIPNGVLAAGWFPVLTHPSTPAVMMLPFEFWPLPLIMLWKQNRLDIRF